MIDFNAKLAKYLSMSDEEIEASMGPRLYDTKGSVIATMGEPIEITMSLFEKHAIQAETLRYIGIRPLVDIIFEYIAVPEDESGKLEMYGPSHKKRPLFLEKEEVFYSIDFGPTGKVECGNARWFIDRIGSFCSPIVCLFNEKLSEKFPDEADAKIIKESAQLSLIDESSGVTVIVKSIEDGKKLKLVQVSARISILLAGMENGIEFKWSKTITGLSSFGSVLKQIVKKGKEVLNTPLLMREMPI